MESSETRREILVEIRRSHDEFTLTANMYSYKYMAILITSSLFLIFTVYCNMINFAFIYSIFVGIYLSIIFSCLCNLLPKRYITVVKNDWQSLYDDYLSKDNVVFCNLILAHIASINQLKNNIDDFGFLFKQILIALYITTVLNIVAIAYITHTSH